MSDAVCLDLPAVGYDSSSVRAIATPATTGPPRRSKRILSLASDDRLVEQVRGGSEAAFEVVFERYGKGILSFCRHMLGSQEEAEDAVQHTFASAYGDLVRGDDRELRLKPWLYTIARNRCLSMLRARREEVHLEREVATAGLAEQVEQRAELRELLGDIGQLPAEQRAALLLAEVGDLSHSEIADVLDCEAARVKALVYRARSSLIERREARSTPCGEIREQLAVLSGGSLRRSGIRHHLRACSGCRAYREEIKRQRQLLAAVLPVVPPAWLKANVLAAAGGGGAAGGAGAAAGGSVATAGAGAGAAAPVGSALLAKAAVLTVLAGGGAVATQAALEDHPATPKGDSSSVSPGDSGSGASEENTLKAAPTRSGRESAARKRGHGKAKRAHGAAAQGRGPADVPGSRGRGAEQRSPQADGVPRGRGPIEAPPTDAPITRGPVQKEQPAHPAPPLQAHSQDATPPPPTDGAGEVSGGAD
jgi:RNA polymerase sigma factor (sigma-70 family)